MMILVTHTERRRARNMILGVQGSSLRRRQASPSILHKIFYMSCLLIRWIRGICMADSTGNDTCDT